MTIQDEAELAEPHKMNQPQEKRFHGWRLLGVIMLIVVALALVSAAVDWLVIGPLEGRLF